MKNPTPREIVLIASGGVSLLLFVLLLFLKLFFPEIYHWSFTVIIPLIVFLMAFGIFSFALESFIYRKIKLIYKSIYKLKAPKESQKVSRKNIMSKDVIGEVEQEVREWANEQSQEIATLKKMAEFRKEFVGNISHELKTPIFNIQGFVHTLIDGAIDDPQVNKDYLKKAAENIERLSMIVADLETISLIESNNLALDLTRFDIVKLIREVLAELKPKAQTKNITLKLKDGAADETFVKADRDRIRQVIINLVANSIRYGNENGTTTIGVYDMDENVLMEASDNGVGIAEEHLPRLFERFYRVDKSRSRQLGGTGLGLSIVKHIVEAHGQTINVRSTPGVGSTFGITLKKA